MKTTLAILSIGLLQAGLTQAQSVQAITMVGGATSNSSVSMKSTMTADGKSQTQFTDQSGSVEINNDAAGNKTATVKAADGRVLFSGPYSMPADIAAAPEAARDRIDMVERRLANRPTPRIVMVNGAGGGGGGGGGISVGISEDVTRVVGASSSSGSKMSDQDGSVEMNAVDGNRAVTVKSPDGTIEFTGPLNSEADRAAIPAAIKARIEKAESRVPRAVRVGQ